MVRPDGDGQWGIITQRDIVTKVLGLNRAIYDAEAGKIANWKLHVISPNTPLQMIAEALRHQNVRRLVVKTSDVPIGTVSQTNLIRAVERYGWSSGLEEWH